MYNIKTSSNEVAAQVWLQLSWFIKRSRFTIGDVSIYNGAIHFERIRLKVAKDYCGNHAGPCRLPGRKHSERTWLEGLDWVAFNDMVNDCLDELGIPCVVRSSVGVFRKDHRRRVAYSMRNEHGGWAMDDPFEDHCGKEHQSSKYPPGTPGIITWQEE